MKKQLLCTSAIALGVAAAPASAQDWNLDWGGYFNTHVGYADVGGNGIPAAADFDGVQMAQDAEIIFTPSITLDNGMTFGVNLQMEAANGGGGLDGIDESYVSVSSDTFGRLDIGFENSAGYKMMVAAPQVGSFAINSGSFSMFLPFTGLAGGGLNAGGSSFTEVGSAIGGFGGVGANNDPMRISYYTPSFNGLTVGISYAPTIAGNAANVAPVNRNLGIVDVFDLGVNYSQSFGTTDLTLSARYGTGDIQGAGPGFSDPEEWGVGFQVGFSGFTVGGAYNESDSGVAGGFLDGEGWSLGVAYDAPGPWTFGFETYQGESQNAGGFDDDYEIYKLAGSRDLGPGVSVDVFLIQGETSVGGAGVKTDATAIGTSLNLTF